jgi:hypothetical protein
VRTTVVTTRLILGIIVMGWGEVNKMHEVERYIGRALSHFSLRSG